MAQECGFFNAQLAGEEYDRVYLAEQFAAYFASFIGNGVFVASMQELEVIAQVTPAMKVVVLPGQGWINGYWYRNTDSYTLDLSVADGVLSRIDLVVLRWSSSERDMYLTVIEGMPSANPQAPSIRRDADFYDLKLAEVFVGTGVVGITQSVITDTRMNSQVCGWVHGLVDQIDTTDLYNQFQDFFNRFKSVQLADYTAWIAVQKQVYLDWVVTQESAYTQFINKSEADYSQYISDTQTAYDVWVQNKQGDYDTYIVELKADYDKYTSDKKVELEVWVQEQEDAFTQFVNTSTLAYDTWISQQEQAFSLWYSIHTQQWEQDFNTWFESIKNKLAGDIATTLQNQIDDLEALQPTVEIGTIRHNKNKYVQAHMYETSYVCGVQGAGEGPAGGGPLTSTPLEYTMLDRNNVSFKAKSGFGTLSEIVSVSDDMYVSLFVSKVTSLVLVIS